jgi:hypothetical protein
MSNAFISDNPRSVKSLLSLRHSGRRMVLSSFLWPLHRWPRLARNLAAGLEKELYLYSV